MTLVVHQLVLIKTLGTLYNSYSTLESLVINKHLADEHRDSSFDFLI